MSNGTLFGMITSSNSKKYTVYALNSFFSFTQLKDNDYFVLIDNDGTWDNFSYPLLDYIQNQTPLSFAANINQLLKIADENELDLVMMNNDVIFTPGWRPSIEKRDDIICLPSCNQTHTYSNEQGQALITNTLALEDYKNNYEVLEYISNHHKNSNTGYFEKWHTAFYLFRLPRKIYKEVGVFDENFQPCGGEDVDYRIRAALKGYQTLYTTESYILHFHGKSTWAGGEEQKNIERRNTAYFQEFAKKYNEDLANLTLQIGNGRSVIEKYNLTKDHEDNFTNTIRAFYNLPPVQRTEMLYENISAPGLLPYINQLGKNIVGCELGVCIGFTLRYFLDMNPNISKVYAIDAYKPYKDHWGQVTQEMVDRWKTYALQLLEPYKDKLVFLIEDSWIAADKINDNELDYIFIDGDHSYAAVARDLRKYWSKVKQGGIFAGHDWNLPSVKTAVEHFRQERNIQTEIIHTDKNVWFWYKGD